MVLPGRDGQAEWAWPERSFQEGMARSFHEGMARLSGPRWLASL